MLTAMTAISEDAEVALLPIMLAENTGLTPGHDSQHRVFDEFDVYEVLHSKVLRVASFVI